MNRCSSPRCWCAWPPTICVFSTGEHRTLEELPRDGAARRFRYVTAPEEDRHP